MRHAELPGGLDGLAPVDVIWASMSLHHVGDERCVVRAHAWRADRLGAVASVPSMLAAAGIEVVFERLDRVQLDAPLGDDARRFAQGYLHRSRDQFAEHLDIDDRQTLAVLASADDPRGVMRRPHALIAASQQIVIARRAS